MIHPFTYLEAPSCGEHGAADIASEGGAAGEGVLDEVQLQLQRRGQLAATQAALVGRRALRHQVGRHVQPDVSLRVEARLQPDEQCELGVNFNLILNLSLNADMVIDNF